MKTLIYLGLMCFAWMVSAQYQVKVKVTQVEKIKSELEICIYKEGDRFMYTNESTACQWVAVTNLENSYTFDALSPGKYAVVVIQDLNGNKSQDSNFLRIPKEPYGFSNNPSTTFGPPDFEGASFEVKSDTEIEIKLK